jgi:hypothetical protein
MSEIPKMFDGRDPLVERLAILESMKVVEGKVGFTPKRTDMSTVDKCSKLRRYENTALAKFNSIGENTYRRFRRDVFKILKSQGILPDLLHNYQSQNGGGLTLKDGFGPYNFGDKHGKRIKDLPPNPYGLSLQDCEHEACTIIDNMIFPGPVDTQHKKYEQRNQPVMFLFAFYDKLFFHHIKSKAGDLRNVFLAMRFNDDKHPSDTFHLMQKAKDDWEEARGKYHSAGEDVQFLIDSIENGNMISYFRRFLKEQRKEWLDCGKDLTDEDGLDAFVDADATTLFMEFRDEYEVLIKDRQIPSPVNKLPVVGAHMSQLDMSALETLGIDPAVFLSMRGTASGRVLNDNPTVDERLIGDVPTPSAALPRRKVTFDRDKPSTKQSAPNKPSAHLSDKPKTKPASFTDAAACKELDSLNAKKKGLAQEIACRRRNLNAKGEVVECLREHLSKDCPFAPKVNLSQMHPMHPLQEDSPVLTLNEWIEYTSGVKDYPGHKTFMASSSELSASPLSLVDILASVIAIVAVLVLGFYSVGAKTAGGVELFRVKHRECLLGTQAAIKPGSHQVGWSAHVPIADNLLFNCFFGLLFAGMLVGKTRITPRVTQVFNWAVVFNLAMSAPTGYSMSIDPICSDGAPLQLAALLPSISAIAKSATPFEYWLLQTILISVSVYCWSMLFYNHFYPSVRSSTTKHVPVAPRQPLESYTEAQFHVDCISMELLQRVIAAYVLSDRCKTRRDSERIRNIRGNPVTRTWTQCIHRVIQVELMLAVAVIVLSYSLYMYFERLVMLLHPRH